MNESLRAARVAFRRTIFPIFLIIGIGVSGCAQGIQWRGFTFEPTCHDAKRDQKLLFVYFHSWASIACTDFEEQVLKSPPVLEALRPAGRFYCVVLDAYADRALAQNWGITQVPGVVILDSEGRKIATLVNEITTEQLLTALNEAVQANPAASQPQRAR